MICDCCRRDVEYVKASFWHGDAKICRECFAQWYDPDNVQFSSTDAGIIGNYVRLRHGLPLLSAAIVFLSLTLTSAAYATHHCLDHGEAARSWPTRVLVKDHEGCWTYDHHPRPDMSVFAPETIVPARESMLMDRWPDTNLLQVELREPEPESELNPEPVPPEKPLVTMRHFALFVSLVLATVSVAEVATGSKKAALGSAGRRKASGHTQLAEPGLF